MPHPTPLSWPQAMVVAALAMAGIAGRGLAQATGGAHVCVGADKVLRYQTGPSCPPGQMTLVLAVSGTADAAGGPGRQAGAQPGTTDRGAAGPGHRFSVPFEVTDEQGKTIFAVTTNRRGFELRTASGKMLLQAYVDEDRSALKTFDPASTSSYAVIGTIANHPSFASWQEGKMRAALGVDAGGKPAAYLYGEDGQRPIVELGPGVTSAGRLLLYDVGGNVRVSAGTNTSDIGVVRVGINPTCLPKAGLIVPDCIAEHK